MSFSRTSETGNYETPATTIGALIEREWDTANTNIATGGNPIPIFIYGGTENDYRNLTEMKQAIVFNDGSSFNIPERTALGGGLYGMADTVIIDIFAQGQVQRKHFEFEIYRILRQFRPIGNNNTPILKSNNTDNSPIHDYDETMPEFTAFDDGLNGREASSKSSAILTVISEWTYA